jgi:ABC-type Fe3+-citrate transport system substrate-binding protein
MRKNKVQIILMITVLAIVSLACSFSTTTANIKDAYLTTDEAGTQKTTVYSQDAVFYCIVQLANAPADTNLKAVWTAVDAKDTEPNFKIDDVSVTTGDAPVTFSLPNNSLWPIGKYKVELFINDKLAQTLEFEVQ